jgi:ABC-type ATPase with predicted acetyltransferase domain
MFFCLKTFERVLARELVQVRWSVPARWFLQVRRAILHVREREQTLRVQALVRMEPPVPILGQSLRQQLNAAQCDHASRQRKLCVVENQMQAHSMEWKPLQVQQAKPIAE